MILYSNNASTTLASGISNSATTIVVATGTGSLFPTISSVDDYFNVTLTDSAKHIEIVTVTARTGDTFTVMRGMENTTARDWLASDILELRITKGLLDQLKLDATKDSALDALVVHNSGNETVQGTKTFSDGIITSELQLSGGTGAQGTVTWNADEETLDLIQDGATLQLGQELQVHCRNNTVSNIGNAVVVMATGTIGMSGRITIAPWDGTTDIKYILGVTTEVIEAGTDGKVTTFGKVRDVDTGAISGTLTTGVIYAKTDGTGGLTYTKPASNAVPLAFLVSAESAPSANNGTIMVRVTPVSETILDHAEIAYGWGNHASAGYATASNLSAHTSNTSNPHSVTATQVGLGNVENKSSATIRSEITSSNVTTALGYTPLSTTGTATDSDKLDGQHGSYYQPASTAITTSNIGSQSVSYATSSGSAGNGGVTSVNGMTGAVTLSTGGVTSLNGQTGAIVNTNIDAIGSIVKAAYIVRLGTPPDDVGTYYFLNAGTAVAGSNLRYNPSVMQVTGFNYLDLYWRGGSSTWLNYGGGGTSLSGTWRCLGRIEQYVEFRDWEDWYYWYTTGCYFVRVS